MTKFVNSTSPKVTDSWKVLEKNEKLARITAAMMNSDYDSFLVPTRALEDGQIYFSIKQKLSAGERGPLLLKLEAFLKETLDPGITVWCEPIGDKNSLRNLRGIEILP